MNPKNINYGDPECSHGPDRANRDEQSQERDSESVASKLVAVTSLDQLEASTTSTPPVVALTINPAQFNVINPENAPRTQISQIPLLLFSRPTSMILNTVTTAQPLQSLPKASTLPVSLFAQALAKVNEGSLSSSFLDNLKQLSQSQPKSSPAVNPQLSELSPPCSLTSAPPSYSFVLRQKLNARRPRLMGTFIPSPSFITHTPPPNYAAAFDIYVDNAIPPQRPRLYHFGFTPMPVTCPDCGYTGVTVINCKITICTHLSAILLCMFCCWLCVPLPYLMTSCKDVYHYCRNCRHLVGMYCPTSPENAYSN